jgi:hypothetical protein
MAESPDDIVGHKTLADGSHLPLTRAEANALLKSCDDAKAKRDALMPDEKAALRMFMDAWLRLKDFGFSEAIYCPKDGSHFQVIEAGSTGIHDCRYRGEWPKGSWEVHGDGDIWPSRPVLYRLYPEDEAKRKAKMEEAARRFAKMDQTN